MKKKMLRLAALMLAVVMLSASALAETITLPASTVVIEAEAFAGDTSISKVIVPEGVEEIGERAFADSSVKEIALPESLTEIPETIFDGCGEIAVTAPVGSKAHQWALDHGCYKEPVVLESDHPYADNLDYTWEYTHPAEAYALAVTFSNDTYVEPDYDFIYIAGADGEETEYTGWELRNETVVVMGNSFTIRLESDGSVSEYGFRIVDVKAFDSEEDLNSYGGFDYEEQDDGTVHILRYTGFSKNITVPSEIDGKTVTGLIDTAFMYSDIESITLPDTLREIGHEAFSECTSLKSIVIPENVEWIGSWAFYGCTALESVTLPEGIDTLPYRIFGDCISLKSVDIPDSVEHIEEYAFSNCLSLTEITIPAGVYNIAPTALSADGNYGEYPAGKLRTIAVEAGSKRYAVKNGMLVELDTRTVVAYPYGRTDATVTIPEDVEIIGENAFGYSKSLKSITIPGSVKRIEYGAFIACENLETVVLEEGVEEIREYVFGQCSNITGVTFPASLKKIGRDTFVQYSDGDEEFYIVTVTAPEGSFAEEWCLINGIPLASGTEKIVSGEFVFTKYKNALTLNAYTGEENAEVVIPSQVDGVPVTAVGSEVFRSHEEITSVVIPEGVTRIGSHAFAYIINLDSVSLPSTLAVIDDNAFYAARGLEQIEFGQNLEYIGEYAFCECEMLTEITIPAGVTGIGVGAFEYCSSLESAVLNGGGALDHQVFYNCYSLRSVTLSDKVTALGVRAFAGTALKEITIPASVTELDNYIFENCSDLEKVVFEGSADFLPYNMFSYCYELSEVVLPEGLKEIREYAFEECSALKEIELPSTLEIIEYCAFYGSGLTRIVLPEGMETIGELAFSSCYELESAYIPQSVWSFGNNVFAECHKNFTIYGAAGSRAEEYAAEYGHTFIADGAEETEPTLPPTAMPTVIPTAEPTAMPTAEPTAMPTAEPTAMPTAEPTAEPTAVPTAEPMPVKTSVLTA